MKAQGEFSTESAVSAFRAILEALSGAVSPALIDAGGWARLRDAVGGLPVGPGISFGFELRLGERAAEADFYIGLPPGDTLAEHLFRLGGCSVPHSPAAGPGQPLAALDTGAPWLEMLALEYDVASGSPGAPPGLFARIRSDLAEAGSPTAETVAGWVAGAVGWRLADRELQVLDRVFDGLAAADGMVDCVGIMPGRPERVFKVNSRPMDPARALPILGGMGWTGSARELEAFLSASAGLFRTLRLAVGVTADGLSSRLGLELFLDEPASLNHPGAGDWGPFLARLREDGLCRPEKMDGLLAWPGREWVFCEGDTFGMLTGITHIKVSFEEAGGPVEAKAYPAAGYLPFDVLVSRFGLG